MSEQERIKARTMIQKRIRLQTERLKNAGGKLSKAKLPEMMVCRFCCTLVVSDWYANHRLYVNIYLLYSTYSTYFSGYSYKSNGNPKVYYAKPECTGLPHGILHPLFKAILEGDNGGFQYGKQEYGKLTKKIDGAFIEEGVYAIFSKVNGNLLYIGSGYVEKYFFY